MINLEEHKLNNKICKINREIQDLEENIKHLQENKEELKRQLLNVKIENTVKETDIKNLDEEGLKEILKKFSKNIIRG